jgi:hypothetical protein
MKGELSLRELPWFQRTGLARGPTRGSFELIVYPVASTLDGLHDYHLQESSSVSWLFRDLAIVLGSDEFAMNPAQFLRIHLIFLHETLFARNHRPEVRFLPLTCKALRQILSLASWIRSHLASSAVHLAVVASVVSPSKETPAHRSNVHVCVD